VLKPAFTQHTNVIINYLDLQIEAGKIGGSFGGSFLSKWIKIHHTG